MSNETCPRCGAGLNPHLVCPYDDDGYPIWACGTSRGIQSHQCRIRELEAQLAQERKAREEAERRVAEEGFQTLDFLWDCYADAADDTLTPDAQELKHRLLDKARKTLSTLPEPSDEGKGVS